MNYKTAARRQQEFDHWTREAALALYQCIKLQKQMGWLHGS